MHYDAAVELFYRTLHDWQLEEQQTKLAHEQSLAQQLRELLQELKDKQLLKPSVSVRERVASWTGLLC